MSVVAKLLRKLLFPKEVANETSRSSCFTTPFGNQRVNGFQTAAESGKAPLLSFFLMNSREIELKKDFFILIGNLKTVC